MYISHQGIAACPLSVAMRGLKLFEVLVVAVFEANFPFRFPPLCSKDREAEVGTRWVAGAGTG